LEKPIRVKILDHDYLIRTDGEEAEVQKIAQFVNNRFREIKDSTEALSERKTAILAAFDIASEYFQLLKDRDHLIKDIQKRAQALNYQIDSIMR